MNGKFFGTFPEKEPLRLANFLRSAIINPIIRYQL